MAHLLFSPSSLMLRKSFPHSYNFSSLFHSVADWGSKLCLEIMSLPGMIILPLKGRCVVLKRPKKDIRASLMILELELSLEFHILLHQTNKLARNEFALFNSPSFIALWSRCRSQPTNWERLLLRTQVGVIGLSGFFQLYSFIYILIFFQWTPNDLMYNQSWIYSAKVLIHNPLSSWSSLL